MEPLIIAPTSSTPLVWFDRDLPEAWIMGNSLPENAIGFYKRIVDWLDLNLPAMQAPIHWRIRLHYFNTNSMKGMYDTLSRIAAHMQAHRGHTLTWEVEEDDEFMFETDESFRELLALKMDMPMITEEEAVLSMGVMKARIMGLEQKRA